MGSNGFRISSCPARPEGGEGGNVFKKGVRSQAADERKPCRRAFWISQGRKKRVVAARSSGEERNKKENGPSPEGGSGRGGECGTM